MVLVGVSQTFHPTGAWNMYSPAADPTGQTWADFPSLGFDQNRLVITANLYQLTQTVYVNTKVWVLTKSVGYAGQAASARVITLTDAGHVMQPDVTYDPTSSALYLVEDMGGTASQWRGSTVSGPVGAETVTVGSAFGLCSGVTRAAVGPETNGGFAPQLGTSKLIFTSDSRIHSLPPRSPRGSSRDPPAAVCGWLRRRSCRAGLISPSAARPDPQLAPQSPAGVDGGARRDE